MRQVNLRKQETLSSAQINIQIQKDIVARQTTIPLKYRGSFLGKIPANFTIL
jgi:hypothetical protein